MPSAQGNINAIVPLYLGSTTASSDQTRGPSVAKITAHHASFLEAFGWLGVPMAAVTVIATLWTTWLIMLMLEPNRTANLLMNTEAFDNGSFWLIIDPEPVLMAFSVYGLCLVLFGYLLVLGRMTFFRNQHANRFYSRVKARTPKGAVQVRVGCRNPVLAFWNDVTGFHGKYRKYWVRVMLYLVSVVDFKACVCLELEYVSQDHRSRHADNRACANAEYRITSEFGVQLHVLGCTECGRLQHWDPEATTSFGLSGDLD